MDNTLQDIIREVNTLFMRYGIKSVTMDDIARHLGISKKTIYSYVKDKNELVHLTVESQIEHHKMMYNELDKGKHSALEEVFSVYKQVGQIFKELNPSYQYDMNKYYPQLSKQFLEFKKNQLYTSIKNNLIKGKKEGVYRKEINENIIAQMQAERHISQHSSNDESHLWFQKETFEEVFLYHLHAILNDKGREELKKMNFFQNQ